MSAFGVGCLLLTLSVIRQARELTVTKETGSAEWVTALETPAAQAFAGVGSLRPWHARSGSCGDLCPCRCPHSVQQDASTPGPERGPMLNDSLTASPLALICEAKHESRCQPAMAEP
jgi:hypothetical protein